MTLGRFPLSLSTEVGGALLSPHILTLAELRQLPEIQVERLLLLGEDWSLGHPEMIHSTACFVIYL